MNNFLGNEAIYRFEIDFEAITVHMHFKGCRTLPDFVENENCRIIKILMQQVTDTTLLFSGRNNEFQQLVFDRLRELLFCDNLCYYNQF
jgi:hypothetical protein